MSDRKIARLMIGAIVAGVLAGVLLHFAGLKL